MLLYNKIVRNRIGRLPSNPAFACSGLKFLTLCFLNVFVENFKSKSGVHVLPVITAIG